MQCTRSSGHIQQEQGKLNPQAPNTTMEDNGKQWIFNYENVLSIHTQSHFSKGHLQINSVQYRKGKRTEHPRDTEVTERLWSNCQDFRTHTVILTQTCFGNMERKTQVFAS